MLTQSLHHFENHSAALTEPYSSPLYRFRAVRMQGYQQPVDEPEPTWQSQLIDQGQPQYYVQQSDNKSAEGRQSASHESRGAAAQLPDYQVISQSFTDGSTETPATARSAHTPSDGNEGTEHLARQYSAPSSSINAAFGNYHYSTGPLRAGMGFSSPHTQLGPSVQSFGAQYQSMPTESKLHLDDDLEDDGIVDDDDAPSDQTAAERLATKRKMKRFRLTHQQTRFLMSEFAKQPHPDAALRDRLSREIPGLTPRQVQVWFQNRRAKMKRLNTDDRERMLQMRTVPEDFDNVRALHSPYGAIHAGRMLPRDSISPGEARSYPMMGLQNIREGGSGSYGPVQPPHMLTTVGFGHDGRAITGDASRPPRMPSTNEMAFSPDGLSTPTYTFSQYQRDTSSPQTLNSAQSTEHIPYYDTNTASLATEQGWKGAQAGEGSIPAQNRPRPRTSSATLPLPAQVRSRLGGEHPLVSPVRGPAPHEENFSSSWHTSSPYGTEDPRDPFGFGFNTMPPTSSAADAKGGTSYFPFAVGGTMPAVTESLFPNTQAIYAPGSAGLSISTETEGVRAAQLTSGSREFGDGPPGLGSAESQQGDFTEAGNVENQGRQS